MTQTSPDWLLVPIFDGPITMDDLHLEWNAGDDEQTHLSFKGDFIAERPTFGEAKALAAWLIANPNGATSSCGRFAIEWNGDAGFTLSLAGYGEINTFPSLSDAQASATKLLAALSETVSA